jgi:hypothetical protein
LASYRLTDWAKISAGIANTVTPAINSRAATPFGGVGQDETRKTYMGLLELTAPESLGFLKDAKLFGGIVDGLDSGFGAAQDRQTSFYGGLSVPTPLTGLSVGAAYDYRAGYNYWTQGSTYANATALYAKYQMNDKLSFANRAEYASGTAGTWRQGVPFGNPLSVGKTSGEEFLADTFTIDYRPWGPNVITRAEFRWDHDLRGGAGAFGGGAEGDKNAMSLALNVIYRF